MHRCDAMPLECQNPCNVGHARNIMSTGCCSTPCPASGCPPLSLQTTPVDVLSKPWTAKVLPPKAQVLRLSCIIPRYIECNTLPLQQVALRARHLKFCKCGWQISRTSCPHKSAFWASSKQPAGSGIGHMSCGSLMPVSQQCMFEGHLRVWISVHLQQGERRGWLASDSG